MDEQKKQAYKDERIFNFLGFTIFDLTHITVSVILFLDEIRRYKVGELAPADLPMDFADFSVEIVCAILLIVFVVLFAEKQSDRVLVRRNYTFAWLVASMSIFIPETFNICYLYVTKELADMSELSKIFNQIVLFTSCFSFFSFLIALFFSGKGQKWRLSLAIGIAFVVLTSLVNAVSFSIEAASAASGFIWEDVPELLVLVIPLVPSGFGLASIKNINKADSITETQK
jgi:hypothetical protein